MTYDIDEKLHGERGERKAPRLALVAAVLACLGPACAPTPHSAGTADSPDPAASDDTTGAADLPDAPGDPDNPDDVPDVPDGSTSSDSGQSPTTGDATTGGAIPPDDCHFEPALAVDCAAIARIIPTGIGVSEAHVVRRHLRLEDAAGAVLGADYRECLLVADSECQPAPVALDPAPSRSITALLVRPLADPADNAALAAALTTFIDSRPDGEPVGVFRWGATVTQIATPTADRNRLHRLVTSGLQPLDGDGLPIDAAVAAVVDPLISLARSSHLSLRQLLVVAPGHPELEPGALVQTGESAHLRVELLAAADAQAALQGAGARLDAAIGAGELIMRQCGLTGPVGLTIHTAGGGPTFALTDAYVPGADQAEPPLVCDPADQGWAPALPRIIALDFSPEERQDYDARLAELSKEPLYGAVRTDLNAPGVHAPVKLKLHGQGSLDCERKSLSLNLTDDLARQWLPDSGTDQFLLVSMCKDDRYITQFTADLLMAELGLFAPKFGMVELVIDGESQGAYLLVERPKSALKRGTTRLRAVVRRTNDIKGGKPELEYASGDAEQALEVYEKLITEAEGLTGDKLLAWLDRSMDLDQYLRWIALMSLLRSGDFVDEAFFMSAEVTGPDASAQDYFTISAWDQDDIFSNCHEDGLNAIVDPHGLLTCVESRLDHAIFAEPKVYARFAEVLAQTLARLDEATFAAATHASEQQLLAILARDEARAAMVELLDDNPDAVDYEVAEDEVLARGKALRKQFAKQRAALVDLLAAYGM